jgi:hypothetical protein
MLEQLKIIENIARRNSFSYHADLILDLIDKLENNDSEFWGLLNSNDVWGGSGSLVDISLSSYSQQDKENVKKDEYEWRCVLIDIYEEMIQKGIINSRAEFATKAFREWNDNGVGI